MVLKDFTVAYQLLVQVAIARSLQTYFNINLHTGSLEKGVYFLIYEQMKAYYSSEQDYQSLSFTSCLIASSSAALLSVPLCYPFEVVRTRMRKDCGQKK